MNNKISQYQPLWLRTLDVFSLTKAWAFITNLTCQNQAQRSVNLELKVPRENLHEWVSVELDTGI